MLSSGLIIIPLMPPSGMILLAPIRMGMRVG